MRSFLTRITQFRSKLTQLNDEEPVTKLAWL